jgi:uncharacterized phage-like protein YoqJ
MNQLSLFPQEPIDPVSAVCFTGHRALPRSSFALTRELVRIVTLLAERGYDRFYAGGAVGFDMLAAEIVLEIRESLPSIRLILALPCREHFRAWGERDRARFDALSSAADELVYVSEQYSAGCELRRNQYMVDRAAIVVAYYNGNTRSGTGSTVAYAREQGKEIVEVAE